MPRPRIHKDDASRIRAFRNRKRESHRRVELLLPREAAEALDARCGPDKTPSEVVAEFLLKTRPRGPAHLKTSPETKPPPTASRPEQLDPVEEVRRAKENPFHKGDIVREFGGGPPLEVLRRRGDTLWVRSLKKHGRQFIELHGPYQVFVRYTGEL